MAPRTGGKRGLELAVSGDGLLYGGAGPVEQQEVDVAEDGGVECLYTGIRGPRIDPPSPTHQ